MTTIRHVEEARALAALREARRTGHQESAIAAPLAGTLLAERFASVDEYGALQITERGQQHLENLTRQGVLGREHRHDEPDGMPGP